MIIDRVWLFSTVGACLASVSVSAQPDVRGPQSPKPWERTAVSDLRQYLQRCLGENPFCAGGVTNPVFHVGDTALAKAKGLSCTDLKDEEWVVRQFGGDVVVNGGGTRGCLYAVSHFLEDVMDVRFWSESEEDVPGPFARKVAALDLRGRPYFFYREIYRVSRTNSTPRLAILRRLNLNGRVMIPAELGGGREFGPPFLCHTFDRYFPLKEYFADHPEWYSLRDGKRVGGPAGQLCLCNKELRKVFKEKVLESIRTGNEEARRRGVPEPTFYVISPNDNGRDCQCPDCTAETREYGGSGHTLLLVNEIAEAVAKEHPEVLIVTHAYAHTSKPPLKGIKPAKNVIISLSGWQANQIANVDDKTNKERREQFLEWSRYTDRLLTWDYGVTFQYAEGFPYPSEYYYGDTYRFWAKNKVVGGMWEQHGESEEVRKLKVYDLGDYFDLKYYFKSRLFEDPFLDADAMIADATLRYFGSAGMEMLSVRERLRDAAIRDRGCIRWYSKPIEFSTFIRPSDLEAMQMAFDRAEKTVCDEPVSLRHVRKVRRNLDRFVRKRASTLRREGDRFVAGPDEMERLNKDKGVMEVVTDADAPEGRAVRILPDLAPKDKRKYFDLPLHVELFDNVAGKALDRRDFRPQGGKGYHWYDFGKVRCPSSSYLFLTREWTLQSQVGISEIGGDGREYDVRLLIKFAGPNYVPGSPETNAIYVARIEYASCPSRMLSLVPQPREVQFTSGVCMNETIREVTDSTLDPEGYRMEIGPGGVTVRAADAGGFFYARKTLEQIPKPWPCGTIRDAPTYSWRGVMVDESRHFFGKEAILRLLDAMAINKLNRFHWHLTDDQGWRIEIPGYPKLTQCGSVRAQSLRRGVFRDDPGKIRPEDLTDVSTGRQFYSVDDIREIVGYAAARNVIVVPEIDLPGHMVAALASYPEYACVPENVAGHGPRIAHGVSEDVLCLGNESAVAFAEGVLAAVARQFPGPYVHIGGDECPRVRWEKCPKCRARVAREKLEGPRQLQAWFIARVSAGLERQGKRVLCWNDAILSGTIPSNVVAMCWRYGGNEEEYRRIYVPGVLGGGRSAVMCPHDWVYANYSSGIPDDPYTYYGKTVNALDRFFSFNPMAGVPLDRRSQILGGQVCCWSGTVYDPKELEWKLWPRTAAAAEALWCGIDKTTYRDFLRRFEAQRNRLTSLGVVVSPFPTDDFLSIQTKKGKVK